MPFRRREARNAAEFFTMFLQEHFGSFCVICRKKAEKSTFLQKHFDLPSLRTRDPNGHFMTLA